MEGSPNGRNGPKGDDRSGGNAMALNGKAKGNEGSERTMKVLLISAVVLILAVPAFVILVSIQDDGNDGDRRSPPSSSVGDGSLSDDSKALWVDFLEDADPIEIDEGALSEWMFKELSMQTRDEMPGYNDWGNGSYNGGAENQDGKGATGDLSDDERNEAPEDDSDKDSDGSEDREVEESDIVKAVGDRLFILNPYRGLMAVDLSDPSQPFVEGRVHLPGTPVSMYIVDFLGFVIVSDAPAIGDGISESTGRLYVIDLTDPSDPVIVKAIGIIGYPIDSRRVGDVIYVVSNKYPAYNWFDDGLMQREEGDGLEVDSAESKEGTVALEDEASYETTHIISIYFGDPLSLGEKERESFKGTSGLIHASQTAIFIPQPSQNWYEPSTVFKYIDISDPTGDIKVRGSINVPGYLADRYQMDHYKGTFRVVTQLWPSEDRWSEFPMSTLYVVDCADPDEMRISGELLIDDRGNLMATRFAGDRGYTIHLPESIDPLDVMDLSDPSDPRLTDVLEIPGWVEHLEVNGYNILAVGVDNENGRNVALYLFDVTNSENAVLKDRVVVGTGSTYSDANYDPKALTILWDQGLVLFPFSSYEWSSPYGTSRFGVQIVSFDLGQGKLVKEGSFYSDEPILRTRMFDDHIAGTSQTMLYSVDASLPGSPVVVAELELAYYVQDSFIAMGKVVSLVPSSNWWGSQKSERCKILVTSPEDPYRPVKELTVEGLQFMTMGRTGSKVFVKGIVQSEGAQPVWELHSFDMSDPMAPVEHPVVEITIDIPSIEEPYPVYDEEEGGEKAPYEEVNITENEEDTVEREEGQTTPSPEGGSDTTEGNGTHYPLLYYDTMQYWTMEDGSLLVNDNYGYYGYYYDYYYYKGNDDGMREFYLVPWGSGKAVPFEVENGYLSIDRVFGTPEHFILCFNDYFNGGSSLMDASYDGSSVALEAPYTVKGRAIGTDSDMTRLYTQADWWDDQGSHTTLGVYDIEEGVDFLIGADVPAGMSVAYMDDGLIVCAPYYWYSYRGGVYYDMAVDDISASEKGVFDNEDTVFRYTVISITLDGDGRFSEMTSHSLEGYWSVGFAQDRTMILSSGLSVIGLRFGDGGQAESLGPWSVSGYMTGGGFEGDLMVIAQGYSGFTVLGI